MTDDTPHQLKKDVVPSQYRDRYKETGGHAGDFIGAELQKVGKDGLPALKSVMKENGIPTTRWDPHNVGMQRMNLANVLRSTFLNGGDIYILGKQYNVIHMRDDYNGSLDRDKPETLRKFAEVNGLQTNDRTVKALTKTFFEAADKAKAEEAKATAKAEKEAKAATAKADKAAKAAAAKSEREAKAAKAKQEKDAKAAAAKAEKKAAKPAKAKEKEPA